MNYWKVILATVVIFGAGVITGGLLVRHSIRSRPASPALVQQRPGPPATPAGHRLEFLRRAQDELKLSAEQRQKVEAIISGSQERTREIMEPVSPLIREEVQRAREEFKAVLNPRQKRAFEEILQKQQQRPPAREPRRQSKDRI